MTDAVFTGSFTQQEPIPDAAIEAVTRVLRSGRLHRYNLVEGEEGEVAALEREYRDWQGSKYCLAVTSGGQSMQIAMRAAGLVAGDKVLTNSFTLAPVPGAIAAVGGDAVLVEIDDNLRLDLDDLNRKAEESGARFLLLSHMRGHLCDMDRLSRIAEARNLVVIEDCAHTMGAAWQGKLSGNFGLAACFSTQTYKHLNSGEGGLLTSDDPAFMARATILSGSYMLYGRHGAGPDEEQYNEARYQVPNTSARMDAVRAAMLRAQIPALEQKIERWNARYDAVAEGLAASNALSLPVRPAAERMVGSSIQFRAPGFDAERCEALVRDTAARGVELKWFGAAVPKGFTSAHSSWRYMPKQALPHTDKVLSTLLDMRLPLTFSLEDCRLIAQIIVDCARD